MTALQPSNHKSDEKAHDAFWALSQFLPQMAGSGIVVGTLAQLACQLEDKGKMQQVLNASDWHYLKRSADFVKHLPPVLRAFNDLGWMDLARRLLQQMTTEKSA
jgi:hypothetical protein